MVFCTVVAAGFSLGAGCDDSRERPTGLNIPVPATEVVVRSPKSDAVLFADSTAVIEIEARGLIQAVEFVMISVNPVIDTVATGRQNYEPAVEFLEQQFVVQLPALISGSTVQIRGFAENLIGERSESETVAVTVVDCGVEPARCR